MGTKYEHTPMRPAFPSLETLRARLAALPLQAGHSVLPFGDELVDSCLAGGGLALGALHEVGAEGIEAETGAIRRRLHRLPAGGDRRRPADLLDRSPWRPAPAGPADLRPRSRPAGAGADRPTTTQTLAAMEAVLRDGTAVAVVAETGRFGRIASRRLQLACLQRGATGFVLRRWPHGRKTAGQEATASVTRWRLAGAAPSAGPGGPGIGGTALRIAKDREPGRPRWRVTLEHARGGIEGAWIMEAGDSDIGGQWIASSPCGCRAGRRSGCAGAISPARRGGCRDAAGNRGDGARPRRLAAVCPLAAAAGLRPGRH